MLNVVSIIIGLFVYLFKVLFPFIFLFFLFLVSYIIIKEIKNKKYSKNPFKRTKKMTDNDYIKMMIDDLNCYKKIISFNDNYIVILNSGVYFLKVLDYQNQIIGNINDRFLYEKTGEIKKPTFNKLQDLKNQYNHLKTEINEEIMLYIVIRNDCYFHIKIDFDVKIIHNRNLYYVLDNPNKKYDEKTIDTIYDKLLVSNYVKKK